MLPRIAGVLMAGGIVAVAPTTARANDPCTTSGSVVTCTGNQSGGVVAFDPAIDGLVVRDLTGPITGIQAFGGIALLSFGSANVNSVANLSVDGNGIHVTGRGGITVDQQGDITTTSGRGIYADSFSSSSADNVVIRSIGNLTSTSGSDGIVASAPSGAASIDSTGNVRGFGTGLSAYAHGDVNVTSRGDVSGGWQGVFAYSANGNATVNILRGNIEGSGGIYTAAGWGGSTATTNISSGVVVRSDTGFAVYTYGSNTVLNNSGSLTSTGLYNTVFMSGNNNVLNNAGFIGGYVSMHGPGVFNNLASGTYVMGDYFNLYSATLVNAGTLMTGSPGSSAHSSGFGAFVQTATGRFVVDADMKTGASSRLTVYGTAQLAGTIVVNPLNVTSGAQERQFTVLSATGGVTNNGLAVTGSAVQTYSLAMTANDVLVTARTDFRGNAGSLNGEQSNVANVLNQMWSGGATNPFLQAMTLITNQQGLANALDQLKPAGGSQSSSSFNAGQTMGNAVLSCRVNGEGAAIIREGQCVWARGRVQRTDVDASGTSPAVRERSESFMAGGQVAIAQDWRLGLAIGHDQTRTKVDPGANSSGDRVNVAGVVKYNPGAWLFAASVAGGRTWLDNSRLISFGGLNALATSKSEVDYLAGRLHAAYLLDLGAMYVKPMIDGGPTRVWRGGFVETGGAGAALAVRDATDTIWSVSPAVEFGTQLHASGLALRPFVKAGVTWSKPAEVVTVASFASAPAGVTPFRVSSSFDNVVADIGAGLDMLASSGFVVRLQYDGKLGEDTRQHSYALRASVPF